MIAELIIQLIGESITCMSTGNNGDNKGCLWFLLFLTVLLVGVVTYNLYY